MCVVFRSVGLSCLFGAVSIGAVGCTAGPRPEGVPVAIEVVASGSAGGMRSPMRAGHSPAARAGILPLRERRKWHS